MWPLCHQRAASLPLLMSLPTSTESLVTLVVKPSDPVEHHVRSPTFLFQAALEEDSESSPDHGAKTLLRILQKGQSSSPATLCKLSDSSNHERLDFPLPVNTVVVFSVAGSNPSPVSIILRQVTKDAPERATGVLTQPVLGDSPGIGKEDCPEGEVAKSPETATSSNLTAGSRDGTSSPDPSTLKRGLDLDNAEPSREGVSLIHGTPSKRRKAGNGEAHISAATMPDSTSIPVPAMLAVSPEIQVFDIKIGNGRIVHESSLITMQHRGTVLTDLRPFAQTGFSKAETLSMEPQATRMVKGWRQGMMGMREGGRRIISVPPELGYGTRKIPQIPEGSTLIFDCLLISVEEAQDAHDE